MGNSQNIRAPIEHRRFLFITQSHWTGSLWLSRRHL